MVLLCIGGLNGKRIKQETDDEDERDRTSSFETQVDSYEKVKQREDGTDLTYEKNEDNTQVDFSAITNDNNDNDGSTNFEAHDNNAEGISPTTCVELESIPNNGEMQMLSSAGVSVRSEDMILCKGGRGRYNNQAYLSLGGGGSWSGGVAGPIRQVVVNGLLGVVVDRVLGV